MLPVIAHDDIIHNPPNLYYYCVCSVWGGVTGTSRDIFVSDDYFKRKRHRVSGDALCSFAKIFVNFVKSIK